MSIFSSRLKIAMKKRNIAQVDLCQKTNIPKSSLSQYLSGDYIPKSKRLNAIAKVLDINPLWLTGEEEFMTADEINELPDADENDVPIPTVYREKTEKGTVYSSKVELIPLIGTIACGTPILAYENVELLIPVPNSVRADFALHCKGDSMIGARIHDGDIVYIRQQPDVENGQIAAVLIDDEATLKRVYKSSRSLTLLAENPAYEPIIVHEGDYKDVRILGLAVSFLSKIK